MTDNREDDFMTRLEGYIKINPKLGHGAPLQTKPMADPQTAGSRETGERGIEQTCSICEKPMRLCSRAGGDREDKPNG